MDERHRRAARRGPVGDGTVELRVWAPSVASLASHRRRRARARARGRRRLRGTASPGGRRRVPTRGRRRRDAIRIRARATSRTACAARRGRRPRRVRVDRRGVARASRSTSSSSTSSTSARSRDEGTFDGVDPAAARAARARRDGDRADAGRDVPRRARLGLRRRSTPTRRTRPTAGRTGLARLVDAAHAAGLGVILDVVYNHVGPGNEALTAFGPYFTDRALDLWGDAIDYAQRGVREWAIQNAELWVRDYHVDGLRLDAVHAIFDDSPPHVCAELARARAARRRRARSSSPRSRSATCARSSEWGHDAQWADELHHELHVLLTGEQRRLLRRLRRRSPSSPQRATSGTAAIRAARRLRAEPRPGRQPRARRPPAARRAARRAPP